MQVARRPDMEGELIVVNTHIVAVYERDPGYEVFDFSRYRERQRVGFRVIDDILVTAPADAFGLAWAAAADARILCWDPATLSRVENEALAAPFAGAGLPVTGVMAFGERILA